MLDKFFNPTPTPYKWDRFWLGFFPSLVLPVVGFFMIYGITYLYARVHHSPGYAFTTYWYAMRYHNTFLRVSTLSCALNPVYFYFLLRQNYYNACRAVVLATMLAVLAIILIEIL